MTLMTLVLLLLGLGGLGYFNYRSILKTARRLEKRISGAE